MSATTPAATTTPDQVVLPAGWSAGPARETTAANPATGQIVQGVQVPISNTNGTQTSVFIPYTALQAGVAAIQPIFDQRISGLTALPGFGG